MTGPSSRSHTFYRNRMIEVPITQKWGQIRYWSGTATARDLFAVKTEEWHHWKIESRAETGQWGVYSVL